MTPTERNRQYRIYLSLIVAFSQFMLMILGLTNHLSFTITTRYEILQQTLNSELWTTLHGLCFVAIITTIYIKKKQELAFGAATGVMSAWSFLNLLWGLSALTPVSLTGPILGGGIATLSYLLTISWASVLRVPRRRAE